MKVYTRALFVCLAAAVAACGGDSPTAPTPTPPRIVNIAGNWIGTFESDTYQPEAIQVSIQQVSENVTGTYAMTGGNVSGNISGVVDASRFIGQMTFSASSICQLAGTIDGPVTTSSIRLASVGFATGVCSIPRPVNVRITLTRR